MIVGESTMSAERPFMTTAWTHLAMLNYEIEQDILAPHVPLGTELDTYEGRTFVSMVGFRFQRTRVLGLPVPFHRNFAEINLRFYVRRRVGECWRRGVVFLKEIVALPVVAWVARKCYDENFSVLPVQYDLELENNDPLKVCSANYQWKFEGRQQRIEVQTVGKPQSTIEGSEEQFIAEHYWGYTRCRDGSTAEFCVKHPPWRIWKVTDSVFECDIERTYGSKFVSALSSVPSSTFLAEGSQVSVYRGKKIKINNSATTSQPFAKELAAKC